MYLYRLNFRANIVDEWFSYVQSESRMLLRETIDVIENIIDSWKVHSHEDAERRATGSKYACCQYKHSIDAIYSCICGNLFG